MKPAAKAAVILLGLMAAGAARLPWEASVTRDLRAAGLLSAPLRVDARERIGQTGSAVALGGLRTLVATFLNLRAYTAYTEQRWPDVEKNFGTIVDLAPHTTYYWETANQHLAYNAGTWYLMDEDLPPLRRRELWRAYVLKGRSFLERGIRNNPDSWGLNASLGNLLSDPNKLPAFQDIPGAFAASAEAYRAASLVPGAPAYLTRMWFYSLARTPGREAEALALGEKILAGSRTLPPPSFLSTLFILRMHADPAQDAAALSARLFPSPARAYQALSAPWINKKDHYPVDGLAAALKHLETDLNVPWEKSVFNPVNQQ